MGKLFASGGGNAFAFLLAGMIIAILIIAPFACLACKRHKINENKYNETIYP